MEDWLYQSILLGCLGAEKQSRQIIRMNNVITFYGECDRGPHNLCEVQKRLEDEIMVSWNGDDTFHCDAVVQEALGIYWGKCKMLANRDRHFHQEKREHTQLCCQLIYYIKIQFHACQTRYSIHNIFTAVQCTVLQCSALYCTVLHCTALHCTVLHCTALYCTVLHCTVLHCTVLSGIIKVALIFGSGINIYSYY